MFAGKIISHLF